MTTTTIVLAIIVLWAIFAYNRLVSLRNRAKEAWADIQVQLSAATTSSRTSSRR